MLGVIGPRQSGSTTLAKEVGEFTRQSMTLDDPNLLAAARADPLGFIRDVDRVVIDEIQRAPGLMLAIKRSVDMDRRPGRFLLTGSANIITAPRMQESMAGRIESVTLLPLSYGERSALAAARSARAAQFLDRAFGGIAAGALDRDTRTHANALMGARLVDAVLSELRKQAGWYDGPLRFSHYRDKDGVEVDVVMESERGQLVGIEIKASATVSAADFIGLHRLRRAAKEFVCGYVLYDGTQTPALGDGLHAAPISAVWRA